MLLTDTRTGHGTGGSGRDQPRVVQVHVSRYTRALPRAKDPLEFLVSVHVEGTAIAWQRNAVLTRDDERSLLHSIAGLRRWSAGVGLTRSTAADEVVDVGRTLRDVFLGSPGTDLLTELDRTALVMIVDETILHLPWEMALDADDRPLIERPFGRVVATRLRTSRGATPAPRIPRCESWRSRTRPRTSPQPNA